VSERRYLVKGALALHEESERSSLCSNGETSCHLSKVVTKYIDPRNYTNYHETQIPLELVLFRVGSWIVCFGCGSAALSNLRALCVSVVNRFATRLHHRDTEDTEAAQRNQHESTFRAKPVAFLLASLLMTSCSRAPSFDILGSYFPAWLICLVLGVVLTAVIRWLLVRLQIEFVFPIVVYPSLTALFAFGMWLVFYS
jgi:hypothetical protein